MTNVMIGKEELVPRVERAVMKLNKLAMQATDPEEKARLAAKAEGARIVLERHRERFQNMRNADEVVTLAAMIDARKEEPHDQGMQLVLGYLMEYAND